MSDKPKRPKRPGITVLELTRAFPDEDAARRWFEDVLWPDGDRYCPRCGSLDTYECSHAKMPYRCRDCRKYFGVKTGTVMAGSPIPLLKWLFAIYLDLTSLKGVSSMKLHRDLGVTQKTAWFMQQRIREAFAADGARVLRGNVEADETYVGGRKKRGTPGRGPVGKVVVAGVKERRSRRVVARVVPNTKKKTLHGFVHANVDPSANVYTDELKSYSGVADRHETVVHSAGEYVRGQAHTNGIESFWSMLKRSYHGTFHKISPKHLDRYVAEFATRHNMRDMSTEDQMTHLAVGMIGRRLMRRDLVADNGLSSGARGPKAVHK